jgi:hypothetical protein
MSTRSNIAIEDPKTKKVKVIYVHSDGYPLKSVVSTLETGTEMKNQPKSTGMSGCT